MTGLLTSFKRFFAKQAPIKPGLYSYKSPADDPRNYQLHLRVEENGDSLLIINASTILHLNKTATDYAYFLIKNIPENEAALEMASRYQVEFKQARQDYRNLSDRIQTLIETPDLDPVTFLDFERRLPFSGRISAPYRLDCALTYRLPSDDLPESAPIDRVSRELTTDEWKKIILKAWIAGIPHIVFTGGEPTLREDLPELIRFAEQTGMVSGLLTYGTKLTDSKYLSDILQSGLDHLLIILRPEQENSWYSVQKALIEDLAVSVHLTITADNQTHIAAILKRLADAGVRQISLSAIDHSLDQSLASARSLAAANNLELVWNLPAPYSALHPVALETGDVNIEGAGRAWIYVEPDGDVLPAQGNLKILGNLINDPWEKIWKG